MMPSWSLGLSGSTVSRSMKGETNVRKRAPIEAMPDQDQKKAVRRIMSQPPSTKKRKK